VVKFRYNAAYWVAAIVALISAIPLATTRWYLAPIALIPLAVAVWAWRAGTDVDASGVRVRALLGSRAIPWSRVESLTVGPRGRVYAQLTGGTAVRLSAVGGADLPRLIAASGQPLASTPR
jgi:PH (Pleckstrin Homology) domain-containing protein